MMLTLHEAIIADHALDIDARDRLHNEVRELIHDEHGIARGTTPCRKVVSMPSSPTSGSACSSA